VVILAIASDMATGHFGRKGVGKEIRKEGKEGRDRELQKYKYMLQFLSDFVLFM
jgi:hypothetical protein